MNAANQLHQPGENLYSAEVVGPKPIAMGIERASMSEVVIRTEGLGMTYRVPVRDTGLRAAVRTLWARQTRDVNALEGVNIQVCAGESVGLIGPNGAGKTTLMKILAGILKPNHGTASVLGHDPFRRRPEYLRSIALVRGSQPLGGAPELTVMDSLRYQQLLYGLTPAQFSSSVAELVELLSIGSIIDRQVRALSLGERMRAGLALALLYRPTVLFFDEPTIGLDVSAAVQTRTFLKRYVEQTGATLLLTSHYMIDVAELCPRVVLVNEGSVMFDGALDDLTDKVHRDKVVEVTLPDGCELPAGVEGERRGSKWVLGVARDEVPHVISRLLSEAEVLDLAVKDAPLDVLVDEIYRRGKGTGS